MVNKKCKKNQLKTSDMKNIFSTLYNNRAWKYQQLFKFKIYVIKYSGYSLKPVKLSYNCDDYSITTQKFHLYRIHVKHHES